MRTTERTFLSIVQGTLVFAALAIVFALTGCGVRESVGSIDRGKAARIVSAIAEEAGVGVGAVRDAEQTALGATIRHNSLVGRWLRLPWFPSEEQAILAEEQGILIEARGKN